MFEEVPLFAGKRAAALQVVQVCIEADLAQRNHHFDFFESRNFTVKKLRALCELLRQRFVVGRSAADGGCDVEVFQLQTAVPIASSSLITQTRLTEYLIH